jgi:hypothetical protein
MSLFYFWFSYIASFLGVHSIFAVNLPPEKKQAKRLAAFIQTIHFLEAS